MGLKTINLFLPCKLIFWKATKVGSTPNFPKLTSQLWGIPQPQYFITLLLDPHWTYFWKRYIYYRKDTKVGSQNFGYQIWFCIRLSASLVITPFKCIQMTSELCMKKWWPQPVPLLMKSSCLRKLHCTSTRVILGIGSANERLRYNITSSLIDWTQTQNDPCHWRQRVLSSFHASAGPSSHPSVRSEWHYRSNSLRISLSWKFGGMMHSTMKQIAIKNMDMLCQFLGIRSMEIWNFLWWSWTRSEGRCYCSNSWRILAITLKFGVAQYHKAVNRCLKWLWLGKFCTSTELCNFPW